MVDSSSQALVDELNTKRGRLRLWPFIAALTVGAYALIAYKQLPSWAGHTALIADSTPFGHSAHADPDTCSTIIRTGSRSAATQGWHC